MSSPRSGAVAFATPPSIFVKEILTCAIRSGPSWLRRQVRKCEVNVSLQVRDSGSCLLLAFLVGLAFHSA